MGGGALHRTRRVHILSLGLLLGACRTPAPPPEAAPPPPPRASKPAPVDPCAGNCRALADATIDRDPVKGLRLLRACLECPNATPATFARVADLEQTRGDPQGALGTLRAGTRAHPRAALLWQLRGRLALDVGQTREGLDALGRARTLRPDDTLLANELADAERAHGDADAKARRTIAPLLEEADGRVEAGDLTGAEDALRAALAGSTAAPCVTADVHRRLALVRVAAADLPGARAEAERGLERCPSPGPTRAALLLVHSDILLTQGEAETALVSATAAAELMPEDPLPLTNVAIARALRAEAPAAIAALRQAVDKGLASRLTRAEVLALAGFDKLAKREDFKAVIDAGWPRK